MIPHPVSITDQVQTFVMHPTNDEFLTEVQLAYLLGKTTAHLEGAMAIIESLSEQAGVEDE